MPDKSARDSCRKLPQSGDECLQVFPQGLGETKHCEQVKGVAVRRERKFHNTERLKIQFLDHNHMFLLVIQIQILRLKDELF